MASNAPASPRFESDQEDGESKDQQQKKKFVADELASVSKQLELAGLDIDQKMCEGRKADRGFTISLGARQQADAEEDAAAAAALVRSGVKAQTLPAMSTRRGDHVLSGESQTKLTEMQSALIARYRRGSVNVVVGVIKDSDFEQCWKDNAELHSHGKLSEGQAHGDERERYIVGAAAVAGALPPIIACQKGSKGFRDQTPNQDNFSLTYFKNGWALCCAFDGHGPFGHLVSYRTVQAVPYFLANSPDFPDNMEKALIEAFEHAQKDVVAAALEENWDVQASGSTAVAACWKGNVVWTANAGDSRCVVGTEVDKDLVFETVDHKPDTPAEKKRIESMGGEVRTQTYSDGWVNHRIFVKGEDYPGLCMARTFGDESVKAHGVVATPQVEKCEVDLAKQPFLIVASDGVWEFLDSRFVIKAVAKKMKTDGPEKTVLKLQREAKKRWKQEEGDYCDDITSILVQLR